MQDKNKLIKKIDAILPQTQCSQCGYDGCKPYATAIVKGQADIDQCPPGGDIGVAAIAAILNIAPTPLNTVYGHPKPPAVAIIDEEQCIGCTLCIRACPVDAIIGAAKCMHTVLSDLCTGCERCIAPCPVDCISMVPIPIPSPEEQQKMANGARQRYQLRQLRLAHQQQQKQQVISAQAETKTTAAVLAADKKQAAIQAAMQRARAALEQAKIPFEK